MEALKEVAKARPPARQAQELPIFSGAAVEWLPFKVAMRDFTILYKFSRSENLARLRSCLRGEAKEVVAALLYTANDPKIIMRTLEQRFGHPTIYCMSIVSVNKLVIYLSIKVVRLRGRDGQLEQAENRSTVGILNEGSRPRATVCVHNDTHAYNDDGGGGGEQTKRLNGGTRMHRTKAT